MNNRCQWNIRDLWVVFSDLCFVKSRSFRTVFKGVSEFSICYLTCFSATLASNHVAVFSVLSARLFLSSVRAHSPLKINSENHQGKQNSSDLFRPAKYQHLKNKMAAEMSPTQQQTVSPSSPTSVSMAPTTTPPATPTFPLAPPPIPNVGGSGPSLESLRFQHLYTLALADRMRLLNPLWPAPRPMPPIPSPGGGPVDPFSPYKGLDPRYVSRFCLAQH